MITFIFYVLPLILGGLLWYLSIKEDLSTGDGLSVLWLGLGILPIIPIVNIMWIIVAAIMLLEDDNSVLRVLLRKKFFKKSP